MSSIVSTAHMPRVIRRTIAPAKLFECQSVENRCTSQNALPAKRDISLNVSRIIAISAAYRITVARSLALRGAVGAITTMALLGVVLTVMRYAALIAIIRLTLRLMSRFAGNAFWEVQRFSTDWHSNNFAGAIVRRITRGMWAVDTMDDILLLEMLPALLVLVGSSLLLGLHWRSMGVMVAVGAVAYIAVSISLSLYYVAPAARLSNAKDTRIGAAMADAITCNAVVKSFGAESREDYRLAKVLDKWNRRTWRTWTRATRNGSLQLLLLQGLRTLVL